MPSSIKETIMSKPFRLLAPAAAALALAAPAAHGMPAIDPPSTSSTHAVVAAPAPAPAPEADGFDWGSAAIGAGVAGLVVLLSGGVAMAGRARVPSTR